MPHYCAYSFEDLFVAACGRTWSRGEAQKFAAMSQGERNQAVGKLAKKAGWQTQDVPSWEGDTFTAFWPKEKPAKKAGGVC